MAVIYNVRDSSNEELIMYPMIVKITENGEIIQHMETADFMKALKDRGYVRQNAFLSDVVKQYNAAMALEGSNQRAEVILRK